jgi:hypothetical protein
VHITCCVQRQHAPETPPHWQHNIADDFVAITATHYSFRDRYLDARRTTMWGTESETLNSLRRIAEVSAEN